MGDLTPDVEYRQLCPSPHPETSVAIIEQRFREGWKSALLAPMRHVSVPPDTNHPPACDDPEIAIGVVGNRADVRLASQTQLYAQRFQDGVVADAHFDSIQTDPGSQPNIA